MIFPVRDYETKWYSADGWRTWRGTYYHGGEDLNLKTGGDTDLGQDILSITDGTVVYVHSHAGTPTFGKHIYIRHDGPWGSVWCHYAHCSELLVEVGQRVKEGQIVARVGKSGTVASHLHWEIQKKLQLEGVANSTAELDEFWVSPILFVVQWKNYSSMSELNIYLGNLDDNSAKNKLREHLGEKDGKCNWGSEPQPGQPNLGGHLGSARSELTSLRSQLQTEKERYSKLEETSKEDREYATQTRAILTKHGIADLPALDARLEATQPPTTLPLGDDIVRVIKRIRAET